MSSLATTKHRYDYPAHIEPPPNRRAIHVLMEEMWRILASRVVTMDTMRRASIMTHASEVVALVGGDSGRIPDLIAFELKQHEEEMNVFSSTDEFSALLPANVEPDERDDDESFS